jgi:molybdopterin-guanine dinucleotide biosynthesis protein A
MDSRYGAIILCGGESSRMGRDKASLSFGPGETLLTRVVGVLQQVVPSEAMFVVAGRRQHVPPLAGGITLIHESCDGAGPLLALVEGLQRLPPAVDAAFVCGCDAPLLKPAFVECLFKLADATIDAVVPADAERLYPLAAVYSKKCLPALGAAIDDGQRSLHRALRDGRLAIREIQVDQLRDVDPDLESLVNCNTPEEYQRALRCVYPASPAP